MPEVTDVDLQLAGIETLEAVGVTHAIVIPPSVEMQSRRSPVIQPEGTSLQVVYPVPPNWPDPAAEIDLRALGEMGWLAVDETDGLVNAFVALAQYETDEAAVRAVRRFVGRWARCGFAAIPGMAGSVSGPGARPSAGRTMPVSGSHGKKSPYSACTPGEPRPRSSPQSDCVVTSGCRANTCRP